MWRSSKRAVVGCFRLIIRCGRDNLEADDIDDMSEYDVHDIPVHFQPQIFPMALQQRQEDFPHRPDAPGTRRRSPPEIVSKMIQALEEMSDARSLPAIEKVHGSHRLDLEASFQLANEEK
ncbi:hypothetical protein KPH14_005676 [Odynerus spinipes]|uniref:Uncharacterized protein n=1 Tax=Odynerus spinipes TaxID=1348599 RepID=A0AAD9RAU5_9HYME|nr:hypothetical protein KPH14_005676 [Odynerus spinipes]